MSPAPATPLIALSAIALDTETTGLDPKDARIVQVAALRLEAGRPSADAFDTLVAPGVPVPPASSAIHGLADADLAGAPSFADVAPGLAAFLGDHVVIGHNIGFDLAVLKAEHARAALAFSPPPHLCTRLLARLVAPDLAAHDLDALAAWLGVTIAFRHTARGDAEAAAAVFLALLPHLRQRGIRTLGEAEAACRSLTEALDAHHRAGWITPERRAEADLAERALARIDAYPYRHRISDVMSAPPLLIAPDAPLSAALDRLMQAKASSLFVAAAPGNPGQGEGATPTASSDSPQTSPHPLVPDPIRDPVPPGTPPASAPRAVDTGILTERDVLRAVASEGAAAFERPVSAFMSAPLECVPADAFLYRAIGRMARLHVRHLGVADEAGRVVGALSQRDLLRLRAGEAVSLGDEIAEARAEPDLAAAWGRIDAVARALVAESVPARDVAAVVSREMCAATRQAAIIAEARMADASRGAPPTDYALLVLGSGGRGESLLSPDQDNAIVHADVPEADAPAVDAWFADLATHVADILDAAGIPYCKGGVMAKNAPWRGSVSAWKARADQWVRRQSPADLLNVDIFFDLRPVHGLAALAHEIRDHAWDVARRHADFAKLLADQAAGFRPPLTFFGGFSTDNGRLDLKAGGLFPIVAAARCLAIRHHVVERGTPARLAGLKALGIGAEDDLTHLDETHALLMDLILRQQLADIGEGIAPGNRVELGRLSRRETERLKRGLKGLGELDRTVRDLLFGSHS